MATRARGTSRQRQEARNEELRLTQRLVERDEAALEEVIALHGATVYGLARMIIGDAARAEEVVQDTMLVLWDTPEAFDPRRGRLRTFLTGIARNKAIDLVRREVSRRATAERVAFQPEAAATRVDETVGRSLAAREALRLVNPDQRQAIFLAYFGGLTYREVAERLRVPEGTVKTRIRDGLTRMRTVLGESIGGEPARGV